MNIKKYELVADFTGNMYRFALDYGTYAEPSVMISSDNMVIISDEAYVGNGNVIKTVVKEEILVPIFGMEVANKMYDSIDIIDNAYELAQKFYKKINEKKFSYRNASKVHKIDNPSCTYVILFIEDIGAINFLIRPEGYKQDGISLRVNPDGSYVTNLSISNLLDNLKDEELLERKTFLENFIYEVLGVEIDLDTRSEIEEKDVVRIPKLINNAMKLVNSEEVFKFSDTDSVNILLSNLEREK